MTGPGEHSHPAPRGAQDSTPTVRRATPTDLPTLVAVLAAALDDTDIARWLVPDPAERTIVYRRYFALVTPWFVHHGTAYITADRAGAALWARLDGRFEPDIADYDRRLAAACGRATTRFRQLDADMYTAHPDLPHHYLAFLAVHPARQGRGTGSALLRAHHQSTDRDRLPAYLEATGPRSTALYRRHGYITTEPLRIGHGPCLFPMLRRPATHPE